MCVCVCVCVCVCMHIVDEEGIMKYSVVSQGSSLLV